VIPASHGLEQLMLKIFSTFYIGTSTFVEIKKLFEHKLFGAM
jgi:hypothetical protein